MDSSVRGKAGSIPGEKKTQTGTVAVASEIAQNLKAAAEDDAVRYDASARNLVAEKAILAYILKSALDEYAEYAVQEIAEKFIGGKPDVRMAAVHPDHPDKGSSADDAGMMSGDDRVEGISTVDKTRKDGTVYYDIRFLAALPQGGEVIEIFVNIEIQNNDLPGYPIPKRGIYYAARMISSQRGTVFKDQEYGKIKKCVSIWLCEDTADARSDTINRYSFTEECLRGVFHEKRKVYDLMTVVVLRLGSKGKDSGDNAVRLLSRMFSTELKYEEKIDTLRDEFHISVTKEISEEVLNVCNLSTGVYNKGYDSGYDSGISAGEMRKACETAYELQDMGLSVENIARAVRVGIDTVKGWLAERGELLVK